ncbi:uncharacterized protein LOC114391704 [Glycine soja]|uniref:uncharacterized protein LOC114391704 n=1 Tax=Glycine soja TaxID=3848 RepID=UPI001040BDAC|nr:uncharacterized protein LOC114391704 [Glycine soja]
MDISLNTFSLFSQDLVFFQNGMMEPWLESKGLEDANQVLAYFVVSKIGETPIDGRTDTNPERLIAAYGKWASIVAARLNVGGLSCKVLDKEVFQKQMLEKRIWICSVMLVGATHGGVSVGAVDIEFHTELSNLITELASTASSEKGLTFEEAMEERLCAYSRAVAHFPTAVREFKWRNGWFYSLFDEISDHGIFLTPLFEPFVIPLLLEKLSSSLHSAKIIEYLKKLQGKYAFKINWN